MSLKDEIKELEEKIEELREFSKEKNIDFSKQIGELEKELEKKYKDFNENELDSWERIQISRNPKRPYTLDYIDTLVEDFVELHGDRLSKDDHAIIGGLASIDGYKIMIIGHQKGRDLDSNMFRNFGMASPEGYRKALRLMKMAEKTKRTPQTKGKGRKGGETQKGNGGREAFPRTQIQVLWYLFHRRHNPSPRIRERARTFG